MKKIISTLVTTLAPLTSLAATAPTVPLDRDSIVNFFCYTLGWLFWGLIVLSVIMVLVAGYYYVTSAGNPEKAGKANKTLLYAAIGIAVAIIAKGVPILVASFIAPSATGSVNAC